MAKKIDINEEDYRSSSHKTMFLRSVTQEKSEPNRVSGMQSSRIKQTAMVIAVGR